jgi:hypothetical protein
MRACNAGGGHISALQRLSRRKRAAGGGTVARCLKHQRLRIAGCTGRAGWRYTLQAQKVSDIERTVSQDFAVFLAGLHGEAVVITRDVAVKELEGWRRVRATQAGLQGRQSVDQRIDVAEPATPFFHRDGQYAGHFGR